MSDPLERGASKAPPIVGEGCTQRYDPQALTAEDGATFEDAAELWKQLQGEQASAKDEEQT
nr:hypothetical protein [uncultured Pseudomonas sp.]